MKKTKRVFRHLGVEWPSGQKIQISLGDGHLFPAAFVYVVYHGWYVCSNNAMLNGARTEHRLGFLYSYYLRNDHAPSHWAITSLCNKPRDKD